MIKIEIFERNQPDTVVQTQEIEDMKSFRVYWSQQASPAYGFRIVDGTSTPATRRVIKESDGTDASSRAPEYLDLTDALLAQIAQFNEYLTPEQVRHALYNGKTIYTNFSRYRLEA